MSQSKPSYGVGTPKDSGNEQYHPPTTSERASGDESQDEAGPEPACQCRHVAEWKWVEIPYTAGLAASYDACGWGECFADGPPDVDSVEMVIRSRRYPSVYHRVKSDDQSAHDYESMAEPVESQPVEGTDATESECENETETEAQIESESVESLTDLFVGDGVTWDCLETPLVVAERNEPSKVLLEGPSGGKYQLHVRYDGDRVVYPGYGCISGLSRIEPDDHLRPEPEAV